MATAVGPQGRAPAIRKYSLLAALCIAAILLVLLPAAITPWAASAAILLLASAGAIAFAFPILGARDDAPMAPLVALVGCDGSGKSTLSGDLIADLSADHRIALCYLGLGSGAIGGRIKRWPLIGRWLERRIAKRAGQTRTPGGRIPGLGTAIIVYLFSIVRLRRFRHVLAMRRRGIAVISDRYPQTEVAGFYDGPGLSAGLPGSRAVAALARRERRLYEWMAGFVPDVVIRLNIDLETAFARKPDHGYELLRRKVEATPTLRFNGAPIVDLDSRDPYDGVRAAADRIVRRTIDAAPRAR